MVENIYQDILVSDLMVNPENPRLAEEADNEISAINALLDDLPERMKTLARDIADKGHIYDPPLVRKEGASWKVYDGNRRVACTKLLLNPSLANDPSHQKFFERLASGFQGNVPEQVNCRIENDLQIINSILERRHAGGDTGIGQMSWRPDEKENFFLRAGIPHKPRFGTELTSLLKNKGILKRGDRLKVSIFDRLLSSEAEKNRVGLTFKGNTLRFIANETKALRVLKRILDDVGSGHINLNKAWSKRDKESYLLHLQNEGFLPLAANDTSQGNASTIAPGKKPSGVSLKKEKPSARPQLIPAGIVFQFREGESTARIKNIVIELQNHLYFSKHLNAIAVSFRVLLEMSVDHYIDAVPLKVTGKSKYGANLAEKFDACLSHMVEQKLLTAKDKTVLVKFKQPEHILSADTFHAWAHHRLAHPNMSDLIAMWDGLQPFILNCLAQKMGAQKVA